MKKIIFFMFLCAITTFIYQARADAADVSCGSIASSAQAYLKDHKYAECIASLAALSSKNKEEAACADYYRSLTRYQQLKYLEESQNWDEYFSQGNTYRDEITGSAEKVIAATGTENPLRVRTQLLLWKFHKDQQDVFTDSSLGNLMTVTQQYAKAGSDAAPLKEAADALLAYGEKVKAKELYKAYVDKLISGETAPEKLTQIADGFWKEGNLDLAESVYDMYIEKSGKSNDAAQTLVPFLVGIAKKFSYSDDSANDPFYAEKIFQTIEERGGKEGFNEELMYLRGFNLEKMKEYQKAKDVYSDFVRLYPVAGSSDKVNYKLGMIHAYVLRDLPKAKEYFIELAQQEKTSAYAISSLYQLGLLSQWEGDTAKAGEYYNQLIEKAGNGFLQSKSQADARVKEMAEGKPIEFNLKTFLDTSLKPENPPFAPSKADIKISRYLPKVNQEVAVTASAYAGESGCTQVALSFLWSGDLGSAQAASEQGEFTTSFDSEGTKMISLTVGSSSGTVDRTLDFIDISQ
jgi:TolA-binding protein